MARLGASLKGDSDAERSWRAERPTPHDLRRTFNSRMAALGVPQEIRAQLLNHAPASIEGRHYDQHNYFDEKRRALVQWDTALAGILSDRPGAVVPIGRAGSPGDKQAFSPIPLAWAHLSGGIRVATDEAEPH